MRPMKVGIQFCGGCNPRIDRGQIALDLQQTLAGMGFEVVFNRPDADIVVFLSGCLSGCAFKYNPKDPPYVTVAAATVDGVELPGDRIVPEVLMKVRQFYERPEREMRKEDHERRDGAEAG
jgi:hypothetical protein